MTWPGRISVGSVMWLMRFSTLSVVPNLSGDRAQRVAGLHLVALAVGSGRRLRRRPGVADGPADAVGDATGDGVACGVGDTTASPEADAPAPASGVDGDDVRATISSRKATTISAISAAWPPTRVRDPLRPNSRRSGSRTSSVERVAGHRVGSPSRARARAFPSRASRAPGRRGTWHRSGVRRRGTAGAASRASAGLRARRPHSDARGSRARSAMSRRRRRDTGRRR